MRSERRADYSSLPKRDFILIPLISFATLILMFAAAESVSRIVFHEENNYLCVYFDPHAGVRGKPNCTEQIKNAEGPWVTYHYNACGYRTYASCGPKRPGTLRLALLGSSISMGLNIPFDKTFGEQAVQDLSRATGRNVEFENLGMELLSPLQCYRRLEEAIGLKPDAVVFAISPFDLEQDMDPQQVADRNDAELTFAMPTLETHHSVISWLQTKVRDSRALMIAEHFLFSNTATYVRVYLRYGDKADYLRKPLSSRWRRRLSDFNLILTDMAARLRPLNIPLLVMVIPSQAQAAVLQSKQLPGNIEAGQIDRIIQDQTRSAGGYYVDVLSQFAKTPQSDRMFYPVDGHINIEGQAPVARALVQECLSGIAPAFKSASQLTE